MRLIGKSISAKWLWTVFEWLQGCDGVRRDVSAADSLAGTSIRLKAAWLYYKPGVIRFTLKIEMYILHAIILGEDGRRWFETICPCFVLKLLWIIPFYSPCPVSLSPCLSVCLSVYLSSSPFSIPILSVYLSVCLSASDVAIYGTLSRCFRL